MDVPNELGPALVIGLYAATLALIVWLPKELVDPEERQTPWWRSVRLPAALVALAQILVYALWG